MTGQIVIEFEGRGVPEITMKGEITSRNITTLERFIRKKYRVYKHLMYKASQEAKPAVAEIAEVERVLESPEPAVVENPMINLTPPPVELDLDEEGDELPFDEETQISEDNENDEERTTGTIEGTGSEEGTGEEV